MIREIVEEEPFAEQLKEIGLSHRRLDEAMESICLTLSAKPESVGIQMSPSNLWFLQTRAAGLNAPVLSVAYTFNDEKVRLLDVVIVK
jgi:hypothetical protein